MKKIAIILLVIAFIATMAVTGTGCKEPEVIVETVTETVTETVEVEKEAEGSTEYGLESGEIAVIRFVTAENNPASVEVFNNVIKEFEAMHPSVKVQLEVMGIDQLVPYYAANIAAGNAPDLGQTWDSIAIEYATKDATLPINDVLEKMGGEDIIGSTSLKQLDGQNYYIPWSWGGDVLWCRTDLFEEYGVEIPETFDEWLAAAEELTLDTNDDGVTDIYGTIVPAGKNLFTEFVLQIFVWQQGETIVDLDNNVHFDSPQVIESIRKIGQLAEFSPPGIGEYSFYECLDAYATGKIAIGMYAGRMLAHLNANNPDLLPVSKAIPIPTNDVKATTLGNKNLVIFKDSKYPEITKDFALYLLSGDNYVNYLLTVPGLLIPVTKEAYESDLFWENEFVKDNLDNIEVCFGIPEYGLSSLIEPGATVVDGKIKADPNGINLMYQYYEAQRIMAQAVQKHVIEGMSPEDAAKWGQAEIDRLVEAAQ